MHSAQQTGTNALLGRGLLTPALVLRDLHIVATL